MKSSKTSMQEFEENLEKVDNPSGEFVPLFKNLKQPTHLWYCPNPYEEKPTLVKKSVAELSNIIGAKHSKPFQWCEGLLIPECMSEHQVDQEVDDTEILDKMYIADTGEFGFALFARVPIKRGTSLCYYGGQIVTKQLEQSHGPNYQSHSMACFGEQPGDKNFGKTTYSRGGALSLCQSAPNKSLDECDFDQATSNIEFITQYSGPFHLHKAVTKVEINPGEVITFDYSRYYWEGAYRTRGVQEFIITPYGEPLFPTDCVTNYHDKFLALKANLDSVIQDVESTFTQHNMKIESQKYFKLAFVTYFLQHVKTKNDILAALIELPKRYLRFLTDHQRNVVNIFSEIAQVAEKKRNDMLCNLDTTPTCFAQLKTDGNLASKRAGSFYACKQFELALQFYNNALPLYELWCKTEKTPFIMVEKNCIYKSKYIATVYMNIASCLKMLGRYDEAADNMTTVCVLQKEMLPTQLFKGKTLKYLESLQQNYSQLAEEQVKNTAT